MSNSKAKNKLTMVLFVSITTVIFSFILCSSVYELIGYLQSDPKLFIGDKWGYSPEEFYSMRILIATSYCLIIVFPSFLISRIFYYILIGCDKQNIVFYIQAIFTVILGFLYSSNKVNELSVWITGGNFLKVHFIIIFCYFICITIIMSLLLPSSNLRKYIRKRPVSVVKP